MMVSVRMAPPLPLIFLLMIHNVFSADWGVSYSHSRICALKNSSVIMSCTYTYPTGYKISKVFWTKTNVKNADNKFPDLSKDPKYSQRLQYLGDEQQNCTIRLSHVTQKDEHEYYFRFTTRHNGKWIGTPGVTLAVTDIQVESPERVTEGDSVRLTCKSSCALTDGATFIWYRNSQPLTERRDRNNQLLLQSVRREDAGRYSCALHGYTYISPAVYLSVTYPPKSVSVSINGSAEIVEGDSVTLICSSDSNPPALNFIWFKEDQSSAVGSGQSFSAQQIGSFYCEAHNQHGSQRSDAVTVIVHGRKFLYAVAGVTGGLGGLIFIFIIVLLMRKKQRPNHIAQKQDDLYVNVSAHDGSLSESDAVNKNDALYSLITLNNFSHNQTEGKASDSEETEEIQYVTVLHHRNKEMNQPEEMESQYDNIRKYQTDATRRSSDQMVEDQSVIYSTVK
ncbi:B-cell receptor CD22-like isoform X1 [Onychostoma macrolepis]|uniref:B-cell receptor CD22-like isoform X1 n=2 Tax=Onychostoma macrolepis TaxID=369639 RepID=UPI00272D0657|nr:B-cell receptor CD22-like isoform X1 [Onychostoma macrolepis]